MKYIVFLFFLCFAYMNLNAQELTQSYLEGLEDEELLDLFNEVRLDSVRAEKVARAYLDRARKERDTIKMARGYDRLSRILSPKRNLAFADSIIELTQELDNITYPGLAYLVKAVNYGVMDDTKKEYENYLKAYSIAKKQNNTVHKIFVLDRMATLQATFGDKNRALLLQKERDSIVNSEEYYLKSLEATRKTNRGKSLKYYKNDKIQSRRCFIYCYLMLGQYDIAKSHLDSLEVQLNSFKGGYSYSRHRRWFLDASMEVSYFLGDFKSALKFSDSLMSIDKQLLSNTEYKNAFLFNGLSYIGLNEAEKGLKYLLKSDSVFKIDTTRFNTTNDRILYDKLNKYYSGPNKTEKKIEYLNRLIFLDSVLKYGYTYFEPKYIREFETPLLLEEKQQLINSLEEKEQRNQRLLWAGGVVLLAALGFLGYYYRRQRLFQKRFEALVQPENLKNSIAEADKNTKESLEIDPEIVGYILNGLQRFETSKGFVDSKISLNNLAKELDTNSNYLSRVINGKKGKGFSQYLSDLRLDYCITELLSQELYRKFTIKAIAEECGFKNAESFSRGFYKKYGIYPSFYIKNLSKTLN